MRVNGFFINSPKLPDDIYLTEYNSTINKLLIYNLIITNSKLFCILCFVMYCYQYVINVIFFY